MARYFRELAFHPNLGEMIPPGTRGTLNVLTGSNNSGKSAYLKKSIENQDQLYVGVNRFYSFHHLPFHTENNQEKIQWYSQMINQANGGEFQNFEGSFFNCSTAITRLKNSRRKVLFDTFKTLFGTDIGVLPETPDNDFSNRFIAVNGESLSVTSSGTRLFIGLLSALMDERFDTVAVDEPELGLSPPLQRRLADIIIRGEHRESLFPHNPNIILSTHSHLFLDRDYPSNNWIVSKNGDLISARRCKGITELHDIQFRLLGNDLSQLFLPDIVIFVEGETDKVFLEKVLQLKFPELRIAVQECGGDIVKRFTYWTQALGNIQVSPYRGRTLIVYDRVKQGGLERACNQAGLPMEARIEWTGNGIEYVYPTSILSQIYRYPNIRHENISIKGDFVTVGEISFKKMELCNLVCSSLNNDTALPDELSNKLLSYVARLRPTPAVA